MKQIMMILALLAALLSGRGRIALAQDTTAAGAADPAISAETDELLRGMGLSGDDLSNLDPDRLHGECVDGSDFTACVYTYDTDSHSECRAMAAIGVAVHAASTHRVGDRRPFLIRMLCNTSKVNVGWRRGDVRYEQTTYAGNTVLYHGKVNRKHSPLAS